MDRQPLWLQILVRTNGIGGLALLTPRQPLTSAPYAILSLNAVTATTAGSAGSVAAADISGAIPMALLPGGGW